MEDAAKADLAATRGSRSRSTLVRRSHFCRFSINNCGDRVATDALTKRCPKASGESHEPAGCAPESAPNYDIGKGREKKRIFQSYVRRSGERDGTRRRQ